MRITGFEVYPVVHREPPLRNSWGAHGELAARTIMKVTTADGTVGVGETYSDDKVVESLKGATELVEGMNFHEHRPLRLRLQDDMVYGAIETALFDVIGKETGQPVHALLGGKSVTAWSIGFYLRLTPRLRSGSERLL